MWCTFTNSSAIKPFVISRYFRLCHSLKCANYAWGFTQVTVTWTNVFPNISAGLLSVLGLLSASACFARMCKMKISGVLLMEQHCCVRVAEGFTQLQAPQLDSSGVCAPPHHRQVFVPELFRCVYSPALHNSLKSHLDLGILTWTHLNYQPALPLELRRLGSHGIWSILPFDLMSGYFQII